MTGGRAARWWTPLARLDDGVTVVHLDLSNLSNLSNRSSAEHAEHEFEAGHEAEHAQAEHVAEAAAWLDYDEQRRARRFGHGGARRRYIMCRGALRSLLCDALGCANERLAFVSGEHGKPSATVDGRAARVHFNVSHSGRHGLIALAGRGRVGVDVEDRAASRHNLDALVGRMLRPAEQAAAAAAAAAGGERRKRDFFLDLWTCKEALSKAHGAGLSWGASRIEIPEEMRDGARSARLRAPQAPETVWRLHNIGTDAFAAALAHEETTA
ncbi:MAG: 4'-phosphopantetheinyl transferase superfamily protein [Acidimicrobiaceae bacterium]|nr:4'-phosphopantetheinyl transferase superfamily protein [Acidimicrobiaceae bacterium]